MVDKDVQQSELSDSDTEEEELDPRIQLELEKLNAATDGINHLETEFGEAQALFQQMMQDATFKLKTLHPQLGKCVDKSRPYYEALKQAKSGHSRLHEAALKFEQAQSRHFTAKKRVMDAEKKAFSIEGPKINPALQEMLNQATIEVMEAARASEEACEVHRVASVEFEEKQKIVQTAYASLKKHVTKSRPYFELKMSLNKQLEVQKQRLEKIQEGIQVSKNAYSDTLGNLEFISDDIHRTREMKKKALLEPRGEGVGAESDKLCISHNSTMERIRGQNLDNMFDTLSNYDAESTDSDSLSDDVLDSDSQTEMGEALQSNSVVTALPKLIVDDMTDDVNNNAEKQDTSRSDVSEQGLPDVHLQEHLKEMGSRIDASYEVITSHDIHFLPEPLDMLDGKKRNLIDIIRSRSYTDITKFNHLFDEENSLEQINRRNSCPTMVKKRSRSLGGKISEMTKSDEQVPKEIHDDLNTASSLS